VLMTFCSRVAELTVYCANKKRETKKFRVRDSHTVTLCSTNRTMRLPIYRRADGMRNFHRSIAKHTGVAHFFLTSSSNNASCKRVHHRNTTTAGALFNLRLFLIEGRISVRPLRFAPGSVGQLRGKGHS